MVLVRGVVENEIAEPLVVVRMGLAVVVDQLRGLPWTPRSCGVSEVNPLGVFNLPVALVGASLAGQKRFAEAEPLLLSGHQGLVERQSAIPAGSRRVVNDAGLRTAQFYQNWGQPEKAREWDEKMRGK